MKDDKYYLKLEEKDYFNTLDKRSREYREYKEWKVNIQDKSYNKLKTNVEAKSTVGLGDVVESIAKATGIKKVVEAITDDCGCDERKEKFNKIGLWKRRKVNCVEQEDYLWLKEFFVKVPSKITFEVRGRLISIYNHVFGTKVKNTSCSSCIKGYIDNLQKYLQVYES